MTALYMAKCAGLDVLVVDHVVVKDKVRAIIILPNGEVMTTPLHTISQASVASTRPVVAKVVAKPS